MARGFLTGAATGLALSVAAAAGLSMFMGYPKPPAGVLPEPEAATGNVTGGTAPQAGSDIATAPSADAPPASSAQGGAQKGAQGGALGLDVPRADAPISAGTDPAAAPEIAGAGTAMTPPATSENAGDIAVTTDAPRDRASQTASPEAPGAEAELSISTDPAQPPQPDMPDETTAFAPPAPEPDSAAPVVASQPDPDSAAPTAEDAPEAVPQPEPEREVAVDAAPSAAEPAPTPQQPPADAPGADVAPDTAEVTETADAPEREETGGPVVGIPARPLTERADAARSTRLPSIGADPDTGEIAATPDAPRAAEPADAPPFARYAARLDAPEGTPRMAIVLIDDGTGPLGPSALDAFPFPVTFAVDPGAPDAAERMAGYREKGFEVLALIDVPEGARASDVEVEFEAALRGLPEVVGVLEGPAAGLQGSRAVSEQVAAYLAASGHGLVMQGQGLNTATSLAQREGVPAGAVFRDIDGEAQDPGMQRRLLDRVALRARQDGEVIAMGRLKADTVSALLLWGLQDRANELALVPVSGVIAPD